jgi:hypothetical protein
MSLSDPAPVASAPPIAREREAPSRAEANAPVRDNVSISPAAREAEAIERERIAAALAAANQG